MPVISVLLAIPVTSTSSERCASSTGNTMTQQRNRTKADLLQDLLLVQDTTIANENGIKTDVKADNEEIFEDLGFMEDVGAVYFT